MQTLDETKAAVTLKGVLNQINWGDNSCQIIADGLTVNCSFPDSLKSKLKDTLGDVVEVSGHMAQSHGANPGPANDELQLEQVQLLQRQFTPANPELVAQVLNDLESLKGRGDVTEQEFYGAVKAIRKLRDPEWNK